MIFRHKIFEYSTFHIKCSLRKYLQLIFFSTTPECISSFTKRVFDSITISGNSGGGEGAMGGMVFWRFNRRSFAKHLISPTCLNVLIFLSVTHVWSGPWNRCASSTVVRFRVSTWFWARGCQWHDTSASRFQPPSASGPDWTRQL